MSQNILEKKYHAFISYRHADNVEKGREWATWLHQAIETYEVPADIVGSKNKYGAIIPSRIYPIFRDEEELPADANLGKSITTALDDTRLLVVLCSPNAVASTYVAEEIDYFKKKGHSDRIIAAMIDGEPNASWDKNKQENGFKESDECFPAPLQFEYDENGNRTDKRAEPIAADFRIIENGKVEQGWATIGAYKQYLKELGNYDTKEIEQKVSEYQKQQHLMLLKIIAGIIGIPLGDLTKRDKEYQLEIERAKAKTLRKWLGAVAVLAILAISGGIIAFFQTEEAIKQQEIAEEQTEIAKEQTEIAEDERDEALMNESLFLMDQARQANDQGSTDIALLLALNALPGVYGGERPLLDDLTELRRALGGEKKAMVFQHSDAEGEMLDKMLGRIVISPDGNKLATVNSKSVKVWSLENGKEIYDFSIPANTGYSGEPDIIFSKNGNNLILAIPNGVASKLHIWNIETGENTYNYDGLARNILLDNGDRVLLSGLKLLSLSTGEIKELSTLSEFSENRHSFLLSRNNTILTSVERTKGLINVWSTDSGKLINEFKSDVERALYYTDPNGAVLLAKGQASTLWSIQTGEIIGTYNSEGAAGIPPKFSPDGKILLLPISFSKASVISTDTGDVLYTIDGGGVFLGGYFSPNSDLMFEKAATGYSIKSVKTGEILSSLNSTVEITDVVFSIDNNFLIYGDTNGMASLWPLNQQSLDTENVQDLIQLAISNLPINRTCLTPEERVAYTLSDLNDDQWRERGCSQFTSDNR